MNKNMKTKMIIACALITFGTILFTGGMFLLKWDFKTLSTYQYENSTFDCTEIFSNIVIDTNTTNIKIVPSDSDKTSVVMYELENAKHNVSVKDDTLVIELEDNRKWYEYIGFNYERPKITVYIPNGQYGNLTIKNSTGKVIVAKNFKFNNIDIAVSTGDVENYASAENKIKIKSNTGSINVENLNASRLELNVSTGKIKIINVNSEDIQFDVSTGKAAIKNITCNNLITTGTTGKIHLENVKAKEKISIKRSTGDIKLNKCDANEIYVKTSSGDVEGLILSDKIFFVETSTGKIDVPKSLVGGKCEIITSTGDIKIKTPKQ